MQRVESEIARLIHECNYDEVEHLFQKLKGGKRLRAKLVLKIAPEVQKAPTLAAIIELIHAASLLHDDIIDDAMTRRGVASVNATNGSKIALMLGDVLYSKAFSELVEFDKEVAKIVASSVTTLSIGEMQDVNLAKSFNDDDKKYLEMLYLKTATLIEATAMASAYLAQKDVKAYGIYGKNLGLAFQIIDDILDITSDEKTLGKPAMNDFVEGKTTLPYIYLYHKLDENEKQKLVALHGKKLSTKESQWIQDMMQKYHTIEESFQLAQKLSDEAKEAVAGESELINILDTMMKRSY
ncbi:Octaprenyl diphosphate synthase / Dimethylallyltransferase / (2E,6E)-farnesyl diphosphate synthase / Geranylgeranyl pyrophosphate synthetase [hydrothermal vent metagenome]|uniref:Octaprenyl diphosphate synthase / Dimethylallyltransferase / (2E,6E)-farnesyl diphosphate synthase / Geranylgeranyl pyrophosphate synthetase n=1 Tax=hydrothermal vent metagenome TaxID=652676 RepID=A0A1W1D2I2_9ZZZZ